MRSGNDGNFCAVNPKLIAIVADTAFVVIPVGQTGRIDFQCCKVIGHAGQILDLKWNPFNDNMIASASDDCTVIFISKKHLYGLILFSNLFTDKDLGDSELWTDSQLRRELIGVVRPYAESFVVGMASDRK